MFFPSGSVTSVAASVSGTTHLTVGGTPITSSGTFSFAWDGTWNFANGSAATPSAQFNGTYGFFYDTTNVGIGISLNGVQLGWFAAGGPTYSSTSALAVTVQSNSTSNTITARYSSDTAAAAQIQQKARGTIASPAVPQTNDVIAGFIGQMYSGAGFTNAGNIRITCTETATVDPTHLGARYTFLLCPVGSGTLTEVMRAENETGLSLFGANQVIDQNRIFRPRAYTVGTVPTVTPTGLIYVTDEGGGGCVSYSDSVNWRRTSDLQVLTASTPTSRGLLGRMTSRVAYVNQDIVSRTYSKLSDAGLLTKLLGLWVFAGAPTSSADALRNWITLGVRDLSIVGSPTWAQTTGFTGDGTTGLLDSGASEATFGATQNSISIGAYVLTAGANGKTILGTNNAATARRLYLQSNTSGALTTRCNATTSDTFTPSYYTGMFVMSRSVSTGNNDSLDDLAATVITRTSAAANVSNVCFLGAQDTTANEFSNATLAFAFIGPALTATDIANLRAIMIDYYLVQTKVLSSTYLVGRLPGSIAAYEGQRLMVSDASVVASGNFGATLTGGGANHDPVYYEAGTPAWRIG